MREMKRDIWGLTRGIWLSVATLSGLAFTSPQPASGQTLQVAIQIEMPFRADNSPVGAIDDCITKDVSCGLAFALNSINARHKAFVANSSTGSRTTIPSSITSSSFEIPTPSPQSLGGLYTLSGVETQNEYYTTLMEMLALSSRLYNRSISNDWSDLSYGKQTVTAFVDLPYHDLMVLRIHGISPSCTPGPGGQPACAATVAIPLPVKSGKHDPKLILDRLGLYTQAEEVLALSEYEYQP